MKHSERPVLLIFACLLDFKVRDNVLLNCPFIWIHCRANKVLGCVKYTEIRSFSKAELFCDETCYFLDIGLSARHAELL